VDRRNLTQAGKEISEFAKNVGLVGEKRAMIRDGEPDDGACAGEAFLAVAHSYAAMPE